MQHVNPDTRHKKVIVVPLLTVPDTADRKRITAKLNALEPHPLHEVCWNQPDHVPEVHFTIGYTQHALFVKYDVRETCHRAVYTRANDPVFKDSCVEFFIAVDQSGRYYNFKCNSLCACLASYGENRNGRKMLDAAVINAINRWVEWKTFSPETNTYHWQLTMVLTPETFCYNRISSFTPGHYAANFYKCGDELTEPHYLAWSPITNPVRDFHQPQFFGSLVLT